jgi:hypothetical protein
MQGRRKGHLQPAKPRVLIYSRDIGERTEQEKETDWNLIAAAKVGGEYNFTVHMFYISYIKELLTF